MINEWRYGWQNDATEDGEDTEPTRPMNRAEREAARRREFHDTLDQERENAFHARFDPALLARSATLADRRGNEARYWADWLPRIAADPNPDNAYWIAREGARARGFDTQALPTTFDPMLLGRLYATVSRAAGLGSGGAAGNGMDNAYASTATPTGATQTAAPTLGHTAKNDILFNYAGTDTLTGDAEDDTLTDAAENDTLIGGAENDTLIGGAGNDTLIGGAGNRTLKPAKNSALWDENVLSEAIEKAMPLIIEREGFEPSPTEEKVTRRPIQGHGQHPDVFNSKTIDRATAGRSARKHLRKTAHELATQLGKRSKPLNSNQLAALLSLFYNTGPNALPVRYEKLYTNLLAGDPDAVSEILDITKAKTPDEKMVELPGLVTRRISEFLLFHGFDWRDRDKYKVYRDENKKLHLVLK